jgi:hypothetical protein
MFLFLSKSGTEIGINLFTKLRTIPEPAVPPSGVDVVIIVLARFIHTQTCQQGTHHINP